MSNIYVQCDPSWPVACEDCEWTGVAGDLGEVVDVQERIMAGEIVPAGECPECGTLAQLTNKGVGPAVAAARAVMPKDFDEHPEDFAPEWHALNKALTEMWS